MNIGKAVKIARSTRRLTQAELAERACLSSSYLSLIEREERVPALFQVVELAVALDIPLLYLIYLACTPEERALPRPLETKLDSLVLQALNKELES